MRLVSLALVLSGCCYFAPPAPGSTAPVGNAAPQPVVRTPPPGAVQHTIVVELTMPGSKPDGRPWDVGGGAPDPCVVVRQGGDVVARSDRMQDSWDAEWRIPAALVPDEPFTVEILDRDLSADDQVFSVTMQRGVVGAYDDDWGGIIDIAVE